MFIRLGPFLVYVSRSHKSLTDHSNGSLRRERTMTQNAFRYLALPAALVAVSVLGTVGLIRAFGDGSAPLGSQTAAADDQDKPKAKDAQAASGAEEDAIRQVVAVYIEARNKGDLNGILALWAPDADFVDESGKMLRGRDVLAAHFKKTIAESKGAQFKGRLHSLKFLRPDVAMGDGTVEMTSADGTTSSNRYAVVWTKTDGKWLISSARDLPVETDSLPSLAYGQLKGLEWLVGEWVDQSDKVDIHVSCRWFENKSFLLMEYNVRHAGEEPVLVRQRVGWDPRNGIVRSWVFDSKGGFGEGYWARQGNRWEIRQAGILPDGGLGAATNSIEFVDHDTFMWRSKDREVDGQPMADTEVKFVRKTVKEKEGP
jgi:uncharacterized protein (TIGR02246 family)